ncbi:hypothetical protein LXL04_018594 [Taraxacum kok-saghyz]
MCNIPYHDHTSSSSWSNTTTATLSPNTSETTTHESKLESSRPLQGGFGWLSGNSLAVEKKSNDPYVDFRESMLQMIMEKDIYGKDELRELLNCFLQLNSPYYHGVIVGAFTSEGFNCSTISSQSLDLGEMEVDNLGFGEERRAAEADEEAIVAVVADG